MIELGRHIEILLLENDCVIVPDFGGFVAYQLGARYDEDDHMWLPPVRTLGFNQQLRLNDSLLVQSYVTAYDISYPDALRRVEDEVNDLKQQLEDEGSYHLENLGLLTVNSEGNYQFEPCEAGILTPAYYGLGGCTFLTLREVRSSFHERQQAAQAQQQMAIEQALSDYQHKEEEAEAETVSPALLEFTDDDNDNYSDVRTIRIRMSWVRNTVAAAAAIIAFFVMATPIANSDLRTRTMSHLQNNLLYKLIPQDTNMASATITAAAPVKDSIPVKVTEKKTEEQAVAAVTQKTAEQQKVAAADAKKAKVQQQVVSEPYCIVLASHVKQSNAEYYVEQLKKRGYAQAAVYIHNKTVRVVYGSYQNESAAYIQLKKLNSEKEFSEAWVYKKPEV